MDFNSYSFSFPHSAGVMSEVIHSQGDIGEFTIHGICLDGQHDSVTLVVPNGAEHSKPQFQQNQPGAWITDTHPIVLEPGSVMVRVTSLGDTKRGIRHAAKIFAEQKFNAFRAAAGRRHGPDMPPCEWLELYLSRTDAARFFSSDIADLLAHEHIHYSVLPYRDRVDSRVGVLERGMKPAPTSVHLHSGTIRMTIPAGHGTLALVEAAARRTGIEITSLHGMDPVFSNASLVASIVGPIDQCDHFKKELDQIARRKNRVSASHGDPLDSNEMGHVSLVGYGRARSWHKLATLCGHKHINFSHINFSRVVSPAGHIGERIESVISVGLRPNLNAICEMLTERAAKWGITLSAIPIAPSAADSVASKAVSAVHPPHMPAGFVGRLTGHEEGDRRRIA